MEPIKTIKTPEFYTKAREIEAHIERLNIAREKHERISDAMTVLINEINLGDGKSLGIEIAGILKATHPTLQQGFIQALKTVIEEHADTAYTDPRNQASVEWCKAVVAESSRGTFPYI
jgi:hypothetical protein